MYGLVSIIKKHWRGFLILPVIYVMLQKFNRHIYLASAYQNNPKEMAVDGPS